MLAPYHEYRVQRQNRQPLVDFMVEALEQSGCRILRRPDAGRAPFRIVFETPWGERIGIVAYAFLANQKVTLNRPSDEHRFQVKYGSKSSSDEHELWLDDDGLYVTLFVGINPERGFFVGADPVLHNPTRFFISIEFKEADAVAIEQNGWACWERIRRSTRTDEPTEVLVGGTRDHFLRYVLFEREAAGEDQGHRQLIAEQLADSDPAEPSPGVGTGLLLPNKLHDLSVEFALSESEVLDLIAGARRLKMAVRGFVAEKHLQRHLSGLPGVSECERLDDEGGPDIQLRFRGSRPITIECKNALRRTTASGLVRVDFMRTRASQSDPCSRYYQSEDFDVLAACLHSVTQRWEYSLAPTGALDRHDRCEGRLDHKVRIDDRWETDATAVLAAVAAG